MKHVKNMITVTIEVDKSELLSGSFLNINVLSKKLGEIEKEKNMPYKNLRNRMYNSDTCGKYNMKTICGLKFIDIKKPMKDNEASLVLQFTIK